MRCRREVAFLGGMLEGLPRVIAVRVSYFSAGASGMDDSVPVREAHRRMEGAIMGIVT